MPLDRFAIFGIVPIGDAPGYVHANCLGIPVLWEYGNGAPSSIWEVDFLHDSVTDFVTNPHSR